MELKELSILELVELLNRELIEGLSVGGICKKYGASKSTIINKLSKSNYKFNDDTRQYEKVFSPLEQLEEENRNLKETIRKLKNELEQLKGHNVRNAGRKARKTRNNIIINEEDIFKMKQLKEDGKTIKDISLIFKCSVGLTHKLINE